MRRGTLHNISTSLFQNLTGSNDVYVMDGATARPQDSRCQWGNERQGAKCKDEGVLKVQEKAASEPHAMHHRDHSLDLVKRQILLRNVWNMQLGRRNMTHVAVDTLPGLSRCASSPHPLQSCRLSWYVDSNVTGIGFASCRPSRLQFAPFVQNWELCVPNHK